MIDEKQIALAQAGDEVACRRILETYAPVVAGYFAVRIEESARDDLIQEVFMDAFYGLHRLRDPHKLGPWLIALAKNKLTDYYRSRQSAQRLSKAMQREARVDAGGEGERADTAPNPAERAQSLQIEAMTMKALGEMKDTYRVVLYLRLFEELSYVEIAERLGLRDGTVRIRAQRGLRSLRKKLERAGIMGISTESRPT